MSQNGSKSCSKNSKVAKAYLYKYRIQFTVSTSLRDLRPPEEGDYDFLDSSKQHLKSSKTLNIEEKVSQIASSSINRWTDLGAILKSKLAYNEGLIRP